MALDQSPGSHHLTQAEEEETLLVQFIGFICSRATFQSKRLLTKKTSYLFPLLSAPHTPQTPDDTEK